jgi:hypothetical protein
MKFFLLSAVAVLAVGCSQSRFDAPLTPVIDDAAAQLSALYPPAKTQLTLAARDAFGGELVNALRKRGYAIDETQATGIPFRYSADSVSDGMLLTQYQVGDDTLNRAYLATVKDGKSGAVYAPMTTWSLRQSEANQ